MTEGRSNNIYFESSGKWNWYKWDARWPVPNHTLQSLHSRPWAWFLNFTSPLPWLCSCLLRSDRLKAVNGHRLQIFRFLWSVEICWRSAALVVKNLEQVEHFHCSDLSRARRINAFALSLASVLDLRLAFSFFNWFDFFGVNWISDSTSESFDSESETIMGSDISGDRSRKNCLIWFKDLSAEVRWSVGDWIDAGGSDIGSSDDGGWRSGSDVFSSFANNLACKSAIILSRSWFCFCSWKIRASFSLSWSSWWLYELKLGEKYGISNKSRSRY